MRLWVGDLFADPAVRCMDESEFGLYMLALCHSWQEGSVPADEDRRARALGVTKARLRKLWPAIERKWESDGNGGLVNRRQERERSEARAKSLKAKEAAEKRWSKR
jgi:uncharacterized protein YdaU (DUF1376 family)